MKHLNWKETDVSSIAVFVLNFNLSYSCFCDVPVISALIICTGWSKCVSILKVAQVSNLPVCHKQANSHYFRGVWERGWIGNGMSGIVTMSVVQWVLESFRLYGVWNVLCMSLFISLEFIYLFICICPVNLTSMYESVKDRFLRSNLWWFAMQHIVKVIYNKVILAVYVVNWIMVCIAVK